MFAGYYFADQIQRYRASPHKPRIDHVAQALISRQYLKVAAQHLREWLRFTADCDARGITLPQSVHARGAGARLPTPAARERESAPIRARVGAHLSRNGCPRGVSSPRRDSGAHVVPGWMESTTPGARFSLEHRGLAARTVRKRVWQLTPDGGVLGPDGSGDVVRAARLAHSAVLSSGRAQTLATRRTYGVTR